MQEVEEINLNNYQNLALCVHQLMEPERGGGECWNVSFIVYVTMELFCSEFIKFVKKERVYNSPIYTETTVQ